MSGNRRSAAAALAIALVPVMASGASAQALTTSGADRLGGSLATGDRVTIVHTDGVGTSGVLVGMTDGSLRVRIGRAIAEIPMQEVAEVQKRGDPPWNGLLIGAVLGAAIGFGTYTDCEPVPPYKTCEGNLTTSRGMETLAAAAMFGAIGLTADLLLDGSRTVYRAAPARPGISVAVAPRRVKAEFRILF